MHIPVKLTLLALLTCFSCRQASFNDSENVSEALGFDTIEYLRVDDNSFGGMDTTAVVKYLARKEDFLSEPLQHSYLYEVFVSENLLLSGEIILRTTGSRWIDSPKEQKEIEYLYSDELQLDSFPAIFREVGVPFWKVAVEKTGAIENEERVWMHPPRRNVLAILELAPFPELRFPIEVGKSWTSTLNLYEGWGKYSYQPIPSKHSISSLDIKTNKVNIVASSKFGEMSCESKFTFSEKGVLLSGAHLFSPWDINITFDLVGE